MVSCAQKYLITTAIVIMAISVSDVSGVLGADPMSLMKIIKGLCGTPGGHDDKFATQFYNCYNLIPMNEKCLFDKCQKQVWGNVLDTKEHIEVSCSNPKSLPLYVTCLMNEFQACKKDFVKAVTTINTCQGQLLGVE